MPSVFAVKNAKTGQVRFRIAIRKRGPKPFSHTELLPFGITKAEALRRAAQIEGDYYRQVSGLVPEEYRLVDAVILYAQEHLKTTKSRSNIGALAAIEPYMGERVVSEAVVVATDYAKAAKARGNCDGTIARNLQQFKSALRWLALNKDIGTVENSMRIKKPKVDDHREVYITPDVFEQAMAQCKNEVARSFFRILFYTGMRRGELFAIVPGDIEDGRIFIRAGKTASARRKVPIHPSIVQDLHMVPFPGHHADIYSQAWGRLETAIPALAGTRLHDLRHSFASNLLNNNATLETVSKLLGHSSIDVTLTRYVHLSADTLLDTVMLIGASTPDKKLHTPVLEAGLNVP